MGSSCAILILIVTCFTFGTFAQNIKFTSGSEYPKVGTKIIINCKLKPGGSYPDEFTWFYNGENILAEDKTKIISQLKNESVLTINSVAKTDKGHYACLAINSRGESSIDSVMIYPGETRPPPTEPPGTETQGATIGIIIGCTLVGLVLLIGIIFIIVKLCVLKKETSGGDYDADENDPQSPERIPQQPQQEKPPQQHNMPLYPNPQQPRGQQMPPHEQQMPPHGQQMPPHGQQMPPHGQQMPPHGQQMPPHGQQMPPHNPQQPDYNAYDNADYKPAPKPSPRPRDRVEYTPVQYQQQKLAEEFKKKNAEKVQYSELQAADNREAEF